MDDLKMTVRGEEELRNEIRTVKTISNVIKMEFGLEKCARVSFKKWQSSQKTTHRKHNREYIKELGSIEEHKYLGVEENHNTEHKNEKEKLKKGHVRRLRFITNKCKN
jgi:hypothetical protein